MTDPHDPRPFRQWATLNADGTVAAMIECSAEAFTPSDTAGRIAVDVSRLMPFDVYQVTCTTTDVANKQTDKLEQTFAAAKEKKGAGLT